MVKEWKVKAGGKHKSVHFRKLASPDDSEQNVLGMLKAGDSVYGEYLFIRRASREAGFVNLRHLEQQGGAWLVANADGLSSTVLRKHATDASDASNILGYAMEGELVEGEFVFCMRRGEKRGGYVKIKHLKPVKERLVRVEPPPDPVELAKLAAALRSPSMPRWAVMDAGHDGAWLRRSPSGDRSSGNIVCLVPNGATVDGELVHLRWGESGERGFVPFKHLEQRGPKTWTMKRPHRLLRDPGPDEAAPGPELPEGAMLEGEFILVSYKSGKHQGYIKRHYLVAMAMPQEPEPTAKRRKT
mmetsp:Transcript_55659/g.124204  ORF Transcript_55659/g.124204 Transcript_55659/m.124204 type:complete len:300 (+) Transcript_55659:38-937(+)